MIAKEPYKRAQYPCIDFGPSAVCHNSPLPHWFKTHRPGACAEHPPSISSRQRAGYSAPAVISSLKHPRARAERPTKQTARAASRPPSTPGTSGFTSCGLALARPRPPPFSLLANVKHQEADPHFVEVKRVRQELEWFYEAHNREKLPRIPAIIEELVKRGPSPQVCTTPKTPQLPLVVESAGWGMRYQVTCRLPCLEPLWQRKEE